MLTFIVICNKYCLNLPSKGARGSREMIHSNRLVLYCNFNINKEESESKPMSAQISNVLSEISLSRKFAGFGSEFFPLHTQECRILPWQ